MSKLDNLIDFGREMKTVSSKKGALIQLSKTASYLTNDRHTVAFVITKKLGTGCFYAEEAPKGTKEVRLRGEKTLFASETSGAKHYIFVATKQKINAELDATFTKYLKTDALLITIPPRVFTTIDPAIIVTSLSIRNNKMIVTQKRADGGVEIQNIIDLSYGFISQDIEDSDTITIYTGDFLLLKLLNNPQISIINGDHPLIIKGKLKGMVIRGLIAYHKFEV